ncbi:hypothetical protein SAMN05421760_102251 [Neptunomonas antarctica]|uniref:Uncharacterized protein n=1 Tax=Neptunomonas antarctica TaxID=619304 RepID=A0A1N7K894_9GAMM|nr:hypothetical protein SAMN05421760_102251 [Neptunomonas antarctica]
MSLVLKKNLFSSMNVIVRSDFPLALD